MDNNKCIGKEILDKANPIGRRLILRLWSGLCLALWAKTWTKRNRCCHLPDSIILGITCSEWDPPIPRWCATRRVHLLIDPDYTSEICVHRLHCGGSIDCSQQIGLINSSVVHNDIDALIWRESKQLLSQIGMRFHMANNKRQSRCWLPYVSWEWRKQPPQRFLRW